MNLGVSVQDVSTTLATGIEWPSVWLFYHEWKTIPGDRTGGQKRP